jgi:hypothetical protein
MLAFIAVRKIKPMSCRISWMKCLFCRIGKWSGGEKSNAPIKYFYFLGALWYISFDILTKSV